MAVQHLYHFGDSLLAAPGRLRDDALPMADGDAVVDGIHIPARQRIRVDPHEHSGLCGGREPELLGGFGDKALFPSVLRLNCDSQLLAPCLDAHPAAPALRDPGRPLPHPGCQLQFLYSCSHLVPSSVSRPLVISQDFSRPFGHIVS